MQFNGIGQEHGAEMHHVTNCMHDHSHYHQDVGGAKMASGSMTSQNQQVQGQQGEGQFSLSAWLDKTLGNGKRLLRLIWGSNEAVGTGEPGDKAGAAQVLAQISESDAATDSRSAGSMGLNVHQPDAAQAQTLHTPQLTAASAAVQPQNQQGNPYFAAVQDTGRQQETIWQKVRVKFKDITGHLAGHLPGNFFNAQTKGSFQAKQERPKEDLRKRSKYRKDELEIDCILTDDSYLLDSYDRKGEYSRISTKK